MCRSQASAHQGSGTGEQRAAGSARCRAGWARLRPAVAHTPDPGLSAGSCVASGASGSAPVPCPARPGPRSPRRRWGRKGAPAAGGGCGARAELRPGGGRRAAPGPPRGLGRPTAGRGGLAWPGLALSCLVLLCSTLPCPGMASAPRPPRSERSPGAGRAAQQQPSSPGLGPSLPAVNFAMFVRAAGADGRENP